MKLVHIIHVNKHYLSNTSSTVISKMSTRDFISAGYKIRDVVDDFIALFSHNEFKWLDREDDAKLSEKLNNRVSEHLGVFKHYFKKVYDSSNSNGGKKGKIDGLQCMEAAIQSLVIAVEVVDDEFERCLNLLYGFLEILEEYKKKGSTALANAADEHGLPRNSMFANSGGSANNHGSGKRPRISNDSTHTKLWLPSRQDGVGSDGVVSDHVGTNELTDELFGRL